MKIDFINDLKDYAITHLKYHKIPYDETADAFTLFMRIDLFYSQYIPPTPRTILKSKKLKSLNLPIKAQESLDKIIQWIEQGTDVNSFQSRNLKNKYVKDFQYSLYGTRHLHLSAEKDDSVPNIDKKGFSKSTKEDYLLFAFFDDETAYILDAIPHPKTNINQEEWTKKEIFEIMECDFPHLINKFKAHGIISLTEKIDDKALNTLTYNGISTLIETSQGVYMPPGMGVAASGDSTQNVRITMNVFNYARQLQNWVKDNYLIFSHEIINNFMIINGFVLKNIDLHYDYSDKEQQFVIIDRNSGSYLIPQKNQFFIIDIEEIKNITIEKFSPLRFRILNRFEV